MTSNPMLNNKILENAIPTAEPMSIQGVINKTGILSLLVGASGYYTWTLCAAGFMDKVAVLTWAGLIAGFVLCLVTCFKPQSANITSPIYALCEGLVLGSVSYAYGSLYNGIIIDAVLVTFIVMLSMLMLYKTGLIKATPVFRKVLLTSTIAVCIFYFAGLIGSLIGHPMTIFNGGLVGIGVSLLICGIAAFNFIIDFDNIENASRIMLPKYFEWYFAFSILVTLVWLYLEVLRLLAQLNSRRN